MDCKYYIKTEYGYHCKYWDEDNAGCDDCNWQESYPKPILTDDTATIRRARVPYCQSCGRDFASPELVYYAPLDGNIVCQECSEIHKDRQLRIYVRE